MTNGAACHGSPTARPMTVANAPSTATNTNIINHVWRLLAPMRS